MSNAILESEIEAAWSVRDTIRPSTTGKVRDAINETLEALDTGKLRVAEKTKDNAWQVNQWAKKAVLLGFRIKDMEIHNGGPQSSGWWDKVDSKFKGWSEEAWKKAGFRAVPNSVVRKSAYIAPGVVLMPSFVNLGAYVDEGTMVDTWATVGSCAQIGKNVHLSGGVGIGGVLEPMQAGPTIIEDNYKTHDGFVVLHGSDTMSYTASALSFMLENLSKPVIFTGSQLPIGDLRTDAKENLITSIQIAALQNNKSAVVKEVGLYFEYKLYRGNRTTKINA